MSVTQETHDSQNEPSVIVWTDCPKEKPPYYKVDHIPYISRTNAASLSSALTDLNRQMDIATRKYKVGLTSFGSIVMCHH